LGLLAVAILQAIVPQQSVAKYMHGGFAAYVIAAAAGVPTVRRLYIVR
jgi:uncharacterized membrane protein YraQ (UPF0718 family)